MRYKELYESLTKNQITSMNWYHGTNNDFITFDPNKAADGWAKKGPGFYLTSNKVEAKNYGNILMTLSIVSVNKIIKSNNRVNVDVVRKMINMSSNLEVNLSNWDEDPRVAYKMALESILDAGDAQDVFESVWYDFYRDDHIGYLKNMIKMGYSGVLRDNDIDGHHFVCFDPNSIKLINKEKIK